MKIRNLSIKSSETTEYEMVSIFGIDGIPYATISDYKHKVNPNVVIRVMIIPFENEQKALDFMKFFCEHNLTAPFEFTGEQSSIILPECVIEGVKKVKFHNDDQEDKYFTLFVKSNFIVEISNLGIENGCITPFLTQIAQKGI